MSNKEEKAGKHDGRHPLVPRLRFPEFREAGEWKKKKLGDLVTFFKGKGLPKSEILKSGEAPCIHYGELFTAYSEVITKVTSRTNSKKDIFLSLENDVLMPTSDVTPSGLAKASCLKLGNIILGGDILIIRANQKIISSEFLARQIRYLEQQVLKFVSGTTVFHLYSSAIEKLEVCFSNIKEQQKIADCLSSLDDLITLESQKLNALKTHKKGLMQQLFPAEGETVPRLRFPEFRDAGEWQGKVLSQICRVTQGGTPDTSEASYWGGMVQWITPAEMGKDACPYVFNTVRTITEKGLDNCSSELLPEMSVIISTRAPIGHLAINMVPMAINQGCRGLVPLPGYNFKFVYYFLLGSKGSLNDLGSGNTFKELSGSILKKFPIVIPNIGEQQKIADCLSSLDDLITAQAQKVEVLKTHKKGLMQQLFPPSL